jgi:hypothetical protein
MSAANLLWRPREQRTSAVDKAACDILSPALEGPSKSNLFLTPFLSFRWGMCISPDVFLLARTKVTVPSQVAAPSHHSLARVNSTGSSGQTNFPACFRRDQSARILAVARAISSGRSICTKGRLHGGQAVNVSSSVAQTAADANPVAFWSIGRARRASYPAHYGDFLASR